MEQIYHEVAIRPNIADLLPTEKKRLEFEELAKLPLSRPQLTVVCVNYGAEIRQITSQLKSA